MVKKHKKLLSLDTKYIGGVKRFEETMTSVDKIFRDGPDSVRTRIPLNKDSLKLMKEEKGENHNYECGTELYKHIEKMEYDSPCSSE